MALQPQVVLVKAAGTAGQWGSWAGDYIAPRSQSVAGDGVRETSPCNFLVSYRTPKLWGFSLWEETPFHAPDERSGDTR